jgi:capsule polysaccharide export protein KpsE/RkpR
MFAAIRRWFKEREAADTLRYAETQRMLAYANRDTPRVNRLDTIIENLRRELNGETN